MSIEGMISARGVQRVLHFTTNRGCLGVLASRALKSRQRLNDNEMLRHIFQPNANARTKDLAWLDYVNLSVSRINSSFYEICSGDWHRGKDFWWCILEFDPIVMMHEGVYFSTTNNIYSGVRRELGSVGFEAMFAPVVEQWVGREVHRNADAPMDLTTCQQAEVLYPGELSTTFLRRIHVETPEISDEVAAQLLAVNHPVIDIAVSPEVFRGPNA